MWEFRPIKREKQAINREVKSSKQFCINNIGRRPTIRAKNKDVIHTRSSWHSYIQLVMGEDKFRQENANDFPGLTLPLLMVTMNANCKGNWCLCWVNGHFKQFVVMVMRCMLTIFPTCAPPMICVTINFRAKRQMIRWVPLESPKVTLRFLNKITRTPTLRARQCGGILARVMVLRNSMLITIAWLSHVSTESVDKNTCSHPRTASAIWMLKEFTTVFFVVRIVRPSMYPWIL